MSDPLILVTNDDGVLAPGISAAAEAVADLAEVIVCAPDTERSGSSHAITFHTHLRAHEMRAGWWRVSGTPVDCVYLALLHLCPRPPDLVISGINAGFNLGTDVFYSGTVGGAAEGYLRGIPSMAVSTDRSVDPRLSAPTVRVVASALMGAPRPFLLNVNVPAHEAESNVTADPDPSTGDARPVEITRLGRRIYRDAVEHRTDPQGRPYYWIGGPPERGDDRQGDDTWAITQGRISVTPLEMDITAPDLDGVRELLAGAQRPPARGTRG